VNTEIHIPEELGFVYPLSPVHNVPTDRILPPTLPMIPGSKQFYKDSNLLIPDVRLSLGDDHVVPMHSLKFIATLQYNLPQNPNPLLISIDKIWLCHSGIKSTDRR
jgi:prolyl oligopeptidase